MNRQAQLGAMYGATLQGLAMLGEGGRVYVTNAVKNWHHYSWKLPVTHLLAYCRAQASRAG